MSQNIVDFSGNPTGAGLMDDYLDKDQQNVLTSNSGIQRPSYAVAGTKWLDILANPWVLKMYDGTDDVVIGTVDPSTHKFIASIPLTTTGDLIVQNEYGKPDRLASGTVGTVLISNGIGQVPSWQKSPYQTTDNLSQTLDDSTKKYPSNAAVKEAIKATAVNYDNITNCITEIPQDIKLELNNGTLTLKAGSKVYVPNGAGKFDEVVIASDLSTALNWNTSGETFVYYIIDTKTIFIEHPDYNKGSGTTFVSEGTYYYTDSNYIRRMSNSSVQFTLSFPLAKITISSDNKVTYVNQVFNGFGYIGSTVFALPGVKGLAPNGRNTDGTLNNIEFVVSKVGTKQVQSGSYSTKLIVKQDGYMQFKKITTVKNASEISSLGWYYSIEDNILGAYAPSTQTWTQTNSYIIGGTVDFVDGKITSFTPKTAFHAVDYNDAAKLNADNTFSGNNTFTGDVNIPTPTSDSNSNNAANTAWVNSRITSLMNSDGFVKKPNYTNYVDIPMTNYSNYTTPADGWLVLNISSNGDSNGNSKLVFMNSGATVHASSFYNTGGGGLMFVPKNEQVILYVESNTTKNLYRFYYTV